MTPNERQPDPSVLPWNGFAIAGFVLALTITPMAFIFSPIALNQFKRNGSNWNRGRGLAIAGLTIAIVHASIIFLLLVFGGMDDYLAI